MEMGMTREQAIRHADDEVGPLPGRTKVLARPPGRRKSTPAGKKR